MDKQPFVFNGIIGTAIVQLASFEYDSMAFANDSANDVFYSVAGPNGPFQKVRAGELWVYDRFVIGKFLFVYAAAAGSAIRVTLWPQGA